MTRACLGLLAGMYALQLSSFAVTSDYLNAVFVAGSLLFLLRQWWLLFWFVVGALLYFMAAQQLIDSRIPANIAGDSIVARVAVVGFPSVDAETIKFLARPMDDTRLPAKIRLSWFDPQHAIGNGDVWQLEVRLRRPRGNRNAGGFDYESWLFREHIGAVGYVVNSSRNHLLEQGATSLTQGIRLRFVSRLTELIDDPEQVAVLAAVVVGTRHLITTKQWQRYAATGSSHLMAISGLHIGLAAAGAYFAVLILSGFSRCGGDTRNHHQIAIVCSLLIAILYAQISGFAVPARRASIMLALAAISLLRLRRPDLLVIVSTTCFVIAVTDPLATMAPGFVLSFTAVAALIWISRRRRSGLPTLQLNLLLGLMPFTAIFFDRISFAALPVNLLAVPLFSFVTVPLSLLGLFLDGPLRPAGDLAILLAGQSVAILEKLLRVVAASNWASIVVPAIAGTAWLYILLPATWLLLPPGWPGRQLACLGVMATLLHLPRPPAEGCAVVTFLDVGQGLAVSIRTRSHTVLYDSGPAYRGGRNAAQSVILPYLRSLGIRSVDRLIISHADLDHAGGAATIAAAMPVRRTMSGEPLSDMRSVPCRAGQNWSFDGIGFSVLHPAIGSGFEGNDRSCVVLLEAGENRILLSGDIEKSAEHALLREHRLQTVYAVSVPHHGSRTSSTTPFIQALQPSVAIVSAAYGNHWGFPKDDVVARWRAVGATVMNTATAGAIEMRVCIESGFEPITQYRVLNRRIWHE
jgi:competence protein ComEC